MSSLQEQLRSRRSCRSFQAVMPSREDIDQIIGVGLYAPTGMGKQSTRIIAVTNQRLRNLIADENARLGGWKEGFDPFYGAPAVMVVLADKTVPTYLYDGSLVMGNMMLAATGMNLGSCWIHRAKECFETEYGKGILRDLGIKGDFEGIGFLAVGYIDGEEPETRPRKENRIFYI